jgi:hypothetical protein
MASQARPILTQGPSPVEPLDSGSGDTICSESLESEQEGTAPQASAGELQMVGEILYTQIKDGLREPALAGKIAGMLLELPTCKLHKIAGSRKTPRKNVRKAKQVLLEDGSLEPFSGAAADPISLPIGSETTAKPVSSIFTAPLQSCRHEDQPQSALQDSLDPILRSPSKWSHAG